MNVTDQALVSIILFFFLPVWGIAGCVDWYCHRKSKIENTSGISESLLHALMGVQVGLPIFLCLIFQVNALILIICVASLVMHEVIAHIDVKMAAPERHISLLEMHAHSYLATVPLFIFAMIIAINWELVGTLLRFGKPAGDQFTFVASKYTFGGAWYLPGYALFLTVLCVIPYLEEIYRCWRAARGGTSHEK